MTVHSVADFPESLPLKNMKIRCELTKLSIEHRLLVFGTQRMSTESSSPRPEQR